MVRITPSFTYRRLLLGIASALHRTYLIISVGSVCERKIIPLPHLLAATNS